MWQKLKEKFINFLRKAQKYTHTDNVYFIKHLSFLTIKDLLLMITSFVMAILFARLLTKETYGQYRYLLSIFALLAITSLPSMQRALTRAIARGKEGMLLRVFWTKLKWGLLGSLVSFGLAFYYFHWRGNLAFAIIFIVAAFVLPVLEAAKLYPYFLEGKKLFNKEALYLILSQFIISAAIALTIFLTTNILAIILAFLFSSLAINYSLFQLTIHKFTSNNNEDKETIRYGKELSLLNIMNIIAGELDKILLFTFINPAILAIYSFASMPINHAQSLLENIRFIAYPKFANKTLKEIKGTLFKKIFLLVLVILGAVTTYILLAPYIFKIFFPQYLESVPYSQWLSLLLLVFPVTILLDIFHAHMLRKELYVSKIAISGVGIILLLIFVPLMGLGGVIVARLLSGGFQIIFLSLLFYLKTRERNLG